MASIANLLVSMKADFGDTESSLIRLISSFKDAGDNADDAKHHLHDLGDESGGLGSKFDELKEHSSEMGEEFIKLVKEALELTGMFEILKNSIEISAEIQASEIALESFTGSTEGATEALEKMEEVANSEALNFKEVLGAGQHMMALGFSTKQTEEALKAAGNASWALGQPIESVSQKMAMMAMSGMANQRMLRSLGISAEELGRVLGVSGDDVAKVFRGMDESERLEALDLAMAKFGDLGVKEANSIKGSWIELKNAWEEVFTSMGNQLQTVTGFMERFGTTAAHFVKDALSDLPNVDALKILMEAATSGKSYEDVSKKYNPHVMGETIPEGETGPVGADAVKESAAKALAPIQAKEAAGLQLARIAGEEKANEQLAALDKAGAEKQFQIAKDNMMARIELLHDPVERKRQEDQLEINLALAKAAYLDRIDQRTHERQVELLKQKTGPEIASKYEVGPTGRPDPTKQANIADEANQKTKDAIAAADNKLALDQVKNATKVSEAYGKMNNDLSTESREVYAKMGEEALKFFDIIDVSTKETTKNVIKVTEEEIKADSEFIKAQTKGQGTESVSDISNKKMLAERAYSQQIITTQAQESVHAREMAQLDYQEGVAKARALQAQIDLLDPMKDQSEIQDLQNQKQDTLNSAAQTYYETITKITQQLKQQSLQYQEFQEFKQIGGDLASGLAAGIVDKRQPHKSIGHDIATDLAQSFRNLGKEMFGTVLQHAFQQLFQTLAANTAIQTVMRAIFGVQAGQQTANTAALTINNTLITALNIQVTALTAAITALTTSMTVNELPLGELGGSSGGLISDLLGSVPFLAGGGEPPIGVPSVVGEQGPELFVPHERGTIVSNDMITQISSSSIASNTQSSMVFNIHGARDARETSRQIATMLRNQGFGAPATAS